MNTYGHINFFRSTPSFSWNLSFLGVKHRYHSWNLCLRPFYWHLWLKLEVWYLYWPPLTFHIIIISHNGRQWPKRCQKSSVTSWVMSQIGCSVALGTQRGGCGAFLTMKFYRQVTTTYMKTLLQKNSPFMDFEIWPKFSPDPLLLGLVVSSISDGEVYFWLCHCVVGLFALLAVGAP